MKILYLAHRIPYPPNKGDKIRSFNAVRCLARNHGVDLVCLVDDTNDMKYRKDLQNICRRVLAVPLGRSRSRIAGAFSLLSGGTASVGVFYSPGLQKALNRWLSSENYDAVVCFSSPMAEYLFRSPGWNGRRGSTCPAPRDGGASLHGVRPVPHPPPRTVMDFCDVDSDKWRQYAGESRFPLRLLYGIESRRLLRYEMRVNRVFDHSVFASTSEADLFARLFPGARNVRAVSNGVDHGFFSPEFDPRFEPAPPSGLAETRLRRPAVVFTGAMDYHANVDGVAWFADEVWPEIRVRYPKASFYIVGSRPVPRVRTLARRPGIHVTGFVEDVRPYYAQADVCVIPLRLARGVQNKVLEALSMARPVVATSRANQGILAVPGEHLLVRDTAVGFRQAVLSLLEDPTSGEALGRRGRTFVCACHDWDRNMAGLEACLA